MIRLEIDELRKLIDRVDEEIIALLAERKMIAKEIGRVKKNMKIPVADAKRENEILENLRKKAGDSGLDEKFIVSIYDAILKNSRDEQKNNG